MNRFLVATAALALPSFAFASGLPPSKNESTSLDFAVVFGSDKTALNYANGASFDTQIKWIGLAWYERLAPQLELGLLGGHLFVTQTDNPATAGIEPDGYYAGVALRTVVFDTSLTQLFLHVRYTYQRAEHEDSGQSITIAWDEPRARLGFAFRASRTFHVYVGAEWDKIDGQERLSGTTSRTTSFKRDDTAGGFLGLDLGVERDGYVGAEFRSGAARGAELYFKKYF